MLDVVAAEQSARLLKVTAVEAEQSIAFATLQALLWPLKDQAAELDPRQAAFLRPVLTLGDSRTGTTFAASGRPAGSSLRSRR